MVLYRERASCHAASTASGDLLRRVRVNFVEVLPLNLASVVVPFLSAITACNGAHVLAVTPWRQKLLPRVVHLELVAHGCRVRLRH